jgi:hypothetical protein
VSLTEKFGVHRQRWAAGKLSHMILLSHKSLSLTFYYGRSTSLEKMAAGYFIIWIKIFCLRVFALISYMRAGNIFSLSTPPLSVLYHVILK